MIEKMKKGTFLVYHKDYDVFLEQLRRCGVVHISEKQKGATSEKLLQQLAAEKHVKQTISLLGKRLKKDQQPQNPIHLKTVLEVMQQFDNLIEEKNKNTQQKQHLQKELDRLKVWGNFDSELLEKIRQAGYYLKFYTVRENFFQEKWKEELNAIVLEHVGSTVYFATLTHSEQENEPEAERLKLPEYSLSELIRQLQSTEKRLDEIEKELDALALNLDVLKNGQIDYQNDIELSKVHLNTLSEVDDKLMVLEAWLPLAKEADFIREMENGDAYFLLEEPTEHENPPILLKNNRFARLYEVIGELYDLPNYHEMDLTAFFAPFYWMFFGLCFGDSGYGLLVMVVGLIMRNKVKPKVRPIMTLAAWLGFAAVLFGTISGTFFGIQLLEVDYPWFQNFKSVILHSDQLFWGALIIGCIQIIFAMFLKAIGQIRRYGFASSLDTWGWILLILGNIAVYALSATNRVEIANPMQIHIIISSVAGVLILLLNNIKQNIFTNFGAGLWNTYNMITGLLGDVLSYIRLFALGISGSVMGFVFNDLAFNLSPNVPVVGQIVTAFILVFGHGINIFMSGLSAIVHPMRLTFVEFYKNAGFEGSGKKYKPFKIIKEE